MAQVLVKLSAHPNVHVWVQVLLSKVVPSGSATEAFKEKY
jgi:hypothetical protein